MKPTIGRVVIYVSRTGDYKVPAIVNCTTETIHQPGVDAGHVPPLSSDEHVHLTVLTPGKPGMRRDAADFKTESPHGRSENVAGCYQEWDIEHDEDMGPGTWHWPPRASSEVHSEDSRTTWQDDPDVVAARNFWNGPA